MRFQFLKEHQKEYNIQKACKILRISRSGYYDYLKRRKSKRIIENEALTEIIEDIFREHQGRYGARRIQQVLLQRNIHVNLKRVSRLMSERVDSFQRARRRNIVTSPTKTSMKNGRIF